MESLWMGMRPDAWQQLTSILLLMIVLIPAAIGDYQHQRVPNWLSMSGWILGPLIATGLTGTSGLYDALLGLGFMVLLFFPLWVIHWFGAADVKLVGTVGAITGVSAAPTVLLGILLAGLAFSILFLIKCLVTGKKIAFRKIPIGNQGGTEGEGGKAQGVAIPYAIPIAFGTMITILYMQL